MQDAPRPESTPEPPHDPQSEDQTQPQDASQPEVSEAAADGTELDPWEQLEAEAAKWRELALRTAAEMENLRKRTAREREEAVRYANQRLLEDLLPVIDNFEMGMMAAAEDKSSMIYIGMEMVRNQLNDFLSGQGAEVISTDGEFDHNLHNAVSQEDSTEVAEGTIVRVLRRGYKLRDRLLRPANVVVAMRPKSEASSETTDS